VGDDRSVPLSRGNPTYLGNFGYPREAGNTSVCSPQRQFAEVVGVSLVNIEDEVGVGAWDSLHNVVAVECLGALPST